MTHSMLHQNPPPSVTVTHCRAHRLFRSGASPVLEVTVSYPVLCPADTDTLIPAMMRFNEAYRVMAEKILDWAQGTPFETAMTDFSATGAAAAYRFDRRLLICDMKAAYVLEAEGAFPTSLTVSRTIRSSSRRGEVAERSLTAVDIWRWPELTLCAPCKKGVKFRKNI
ncbi:MAG: hypothetical protein IJX72_04270 [Clostridia bacterium]|nr:hypothetical protein [Clostridia bacterium]